MDPQADPQEHQTLEINAAKAKPAEEEEKVENVWFPPSHLSCREGGGSRRSWLESSKEEQR